MKLLPLPDARPRETITYRCAICGEEGLLEEGMATAKGLACSRCGPYADNLYPGASVAVTDTTSSLAPPCPAPPARWGRT